MIVEVTEYVASFLEGLMDSIDEKDSGTRTMRSVLLEAVAAVGVAYASQSRRPAHMSTGHP